MKCCEVFLERHSAPAGEDHGEVHFGIAMKASGSFRFMPSMSACMYVCMLACTHACVCIGIVATGFAAVLSTVDGQNLAPLSVGGRVPSRSHFNIGVCVVALRLGGTNGQNLAPPRWLPNIESGGKGG